jgi:glycosyltransferase involved in cell wall biosynthesis
LRVLHLADRLSDRGGAHWYLRGLIHQQRLLGHEVHLAVGERAAGIADPCPVSQVPGLEARTRAGVELEGLLRRVDPDAVHVHSVVNPAALERAAAAGAVMTVQDHRCFCPTRGKWTRAGEPCTRPLSEDACSACFDDAAYFQDVFALTAERLAAVRRMRRLLVLSEYMRRELVAAGVAERRVDVVPPFVHGLDLAAEPEAGPCVLFVGRLAEAKGPWDALAAWRAAGLGLPLRMAGTGPLRQALSSSAGAEVLGWVDRTRLSRLLRSARALLMPSRWQEPFGIAGLEALTFGVPVAAFASGGIPEWHPGGPGLAPWGDVAALTRGLRSVAGTRPPPPRGFGAVPLTGRVVAAYEAASVASRADSD